MGALSAGELTERVALLADAPGLPDGRGGHLPGASTETTVWARVRVLSAKEVVALGQVLDTAAVEITLRQRPGLSARQRVRWRGQTYNVTGAVPDETREFTRLTCFTSGQ